MTAAIQFHPFDGPGITDGLLTPEGIVRILVHLPQLTRKEATAPVGLMHHAETTVALDATRHETPVLALLSDLIDLL